MRGCEVGEGWEGEGKEWTTSSTSRWPRHGCSSGDHHHPRGTGQPPMRRAWMLTATPAAAAEARTAVARGSPAVGPHASKPPPYASSPPPPLPPPAPSGSQRDPYPRRRWHGTACTRRMAEPAAALRVYRQRRPASSSPRSPLSALVHHAAATPARPCAPTAEPAEAAARGRQRAVSGRGSAWHAAVGPRASVATAAQQRWLTGGRRMGRLATATPTPAKPPHPPHPQVG